MLKNSPALKEWILFLKKKLLYPSMSASFMDLEGVNEPMERFLVEMKYASLKATSIVKRKEAICPYRE